ncbi:MAG: UPF0182 family protein [Actinomycetaceae bacterium]|nr:UPF0182 family protein [Arcanobacterium sp.]MDD7505290.1 UPF0182 family protein [Actinomycetaceae bacterium]MDY6143516.1 UPF0182 family protein [Arcanobacterium sp.]
MSTTSAVPPQGQSPSANNKGQGLRGGAFVPTLIVLAALLFLLAVFSSLFTEYSWFSQIGALRVFLTQYGAWIVFAALGVLLVGGAWVLNLRIALGRKRDTETTYVDEALEKQFSAVSILDGNRWLSYGLVPLVIGLVFGAGLGSSWQTFLLWFNGGDFGSADPEYGLDVSFFVFVLPALHIVLGLISSMLLVSLVAAIAGYWMRGKISIKDAALKVSRKAQMHLGILAALVAVRFAVNFWLARYDLLLSDNDRFSGASFTDIKASKPGLTILAIVVLLVAVLFVYAGIRARWKLAWVGVAATVVSAIMLGSVYPALIQNFKVDPNAAELESEYIQRNIDATLSAYGLDDVEVQAYAARTDAESGQLRQDSETAAQIRLLDPNIVDPSFNQLQQNRQYYEFVAPLAVDRYDVDGTMRDTVVGVRELNLDGLDDSRRSWVNDHTVFTHGFGVAAAYGNTVTAKGDPAFWEAGIPSSGELGEYEPRVYFGQQSPDYSIVGAPEGNDPWELDYPDDNAPNGQVNNTYAGDGGPKITNLMAKLLYAIHFRSTELFFSERVTNESQILFDRDPHKRVEKVAPYLTLDSKAIPAVVDMDDDPDTPKELVWIIDGYTTSNSYPYSARETLEEATSDFLNSRGLVTSNTESVNYIRNSVKAVVNAYDGSVKLFAWDANDPIISAWGKIFPGQLTSLSDMPGDLIAHVRYPEDLFKVQRSLLARYHVEDAKSFYSGGDFWQVPREPTAEAGTDAPAQPPYYLTLQMPGQDSASFSLTTSYIPGGNTNRNVMTGFLAADSNAGNESGKIADSYGKLRLLEAPRDLTVSGPGQAENTMLTTPTVSTALNLLRNGGTTVTEGNLLSLPVGGGLLYVQPIYVQASQGTQYPTLQYVLTMFGDQVGFAPTLDESLDMLFGGDSGVNAGDASIVGEKEAPVDAAGSASAGGEAAGMDSSDTHSGDLPTAPAEPAPATPAPAAPVAPADGATGDAQQRLTQALNDAQKAIEESNAAQRNNDWTAYGQAQQKLADAIEAATKAQQDLGK